MADDGGKADWQEQWKGLIGKLVTASREGIRNASKFELVVCSLRQYIPSIRFCVLTCGRLSALLSRDG